MEDQEDVLTPAPAHVISGPPGGGGWRNPLAAVCGTLTLDNVSESASWRPQDTGKSFIGRDSAPDCVRGA